MATTEKKLSLIDEEKKELKVYHPEDHEELFADRVGMPSHRIYETKEGRRALKGMKIVEERFHDRSWYSVVVERAQKYMDEEAIFYRGTSVTYREIDRKSVV